jgi:hypothetical protein
METQVRHLKKKSGISTVLYPKTLLKQFTWPPIHNFSVLDKTTAPFSTLRYTSNSFPLYCIDSNLETKNGLQSNPRHHINANLKQ